MSTKSLGSFLRVTLSLILTLGSTTLLRPPISPAAGIHTVTKVTDTNDGICDADCSLREAIATAAAGDTIFFASSLAWQTITLGSQLTISTDLTIDGEAHAITVSGNYTTCVFDINSVVIIRHLSIVKGYGCGIVNSGTLTVMNSLISDNQCFDGGGILNHGTLTVINSTLSGNTASGGGLWDDNLGGGIANEGILTVQNSTISSNSGIQGGGIFNLGMLVVQNSTFSNNASDDGGGIYNIGTLNYQNTIIANSISSGDCVSNGTIGVNNHNLVEDGGCSSAFTGDPLLDSLTDNGGDTQTHALQPGSPAIDKGDDATCLSTDQRGVPRPQGAHCDIGAYEYVLDTTPPMVNSITRLNPNPTDLASVDFSVTFSEPVTKVHARDFSLTTVGVSGASLTGVSGTGSVYTATVNTGICGGTIRLDVPASATITDFALNPLANLPFRDGDSYTTTERACFQNYLPMVLR